MTEMRKQTVLTIQVVFTILLVGAWCGAQQPTVQITSHADGTVVQPGQTITLVVTASPSTSFATLMLSADDPLTVTYSQNPSQFSVGVPAATSLGPHQLRAIGALASGGGAIVTSTPISVDVERPDPAPYVLRAELDSLQFGAVGEQKSLRIICTFSDQSQNDCMRSTKTSYTSNNAQVATVNGTGVVTAAGPGRTRVVVNYAGKLYSIPIKVSDFSVAATPPTQTITAGAGTSYTITLSSLYGFPGTPALSVTGLPTGATATFNPTVTSDPMPSTMNISTSITTAPGSYPLTITATDSSTNLSHSVTATLVVNHASKL